MGQNSNENKFASIKSFNYFSVMVLLKSLLINHHYPIPSFPPNGQFRVFEIALQDRGDPPSRGNERFCGGIFWGVVRI